MRSVVTPYTHDVAVLSALEVLGVPVGLAEAPPGAYEGVETRTGPDYCVVYPIGGGRRNGPLADPYGDVEFVYQITVVGRSALGVRHLVGRLEGALLDLTVEGRQVSFVQPDDLEGVYPDRDAETVTFYATPRFRIATTPA